MDQYFNQKFVLVASHGNGNWNIWLIKRYEKQKYLIPFKDCLKLWSSDLQATESEKPDRLKRTEKYLWKAAVKAMMLWKKEVRPVVWLICIASALSA